MHADIGSRQRRTTPISLVVVLMLSFAASGCSVFMNYAICRLSVNGSTDMDIQYKDEEGALICVQNWHPRIPFDAWEHDLDLQKGIKK